MEWILLAAFLGVKLCLATEVFYVLPNNSTSVSCPSSYNCATLSQYLMDNNGTLPVVSNVEYHFLPGEHLLMSKLTIQNASNFSMVGCSIQFLAVIACLSDSLIAIIHSDAVTIETLVFNNCSGTVHHLFSRYITSLELISCDLCTVDGITFLEYGIMGMNLIGRSFLTNITIIFTQKYDSELCSGILLIYHDRNNHSWDNLAVIINVKVSGNGGKGIEIQSTENQHAAAIIEITNSQFLNMNYPAIQVEIAHFYTTSVNKVLIESSLFKSNNFEVIKADSIPHDQTTFTISNCTFTDNHKITSVKITGDFLNGQEPTNITIKDCNFLHNNGQLLNVWSYEQCNTSIIMTGSIYIYNTTGYFDMTYLYQVVVQTSGSILIVRNHVDRVMVFESCDVMLSKNMTFRQNRCLEIILLLSDLTCIKIMEYSRFVISDNYNKCLNYPISIKSEKYFDNPYPFCLFQYMAVDDKTSETKNYTIIIHDDALLRTFTSTPISRMFSLLLTSHCKWLPSTAFYGYHPGPMNKQIIVQEDVKHELKYICYCTENGIINCSVDILGPVYPGQLLQIYLCILHEGNMKTSVMFVETHSKLLPKSSCRLANKAQFIQTVTKYSKKANNFTIVSEAAEECELFLTAEPYLHKIYSGFYVKLMHCPIGFALQDGVCDCDPILYASNAHIDKCDID